MFAAPARARRTTGRCSPRRGPRRLASRRNLTWDRTCSSVTRADFLPPCVRPGWAIAAASRRFSSFSAAIACRPRSADGETRTISFHHIHTKEDLTITYKRNGRYDEEALKKINHFLRDWREDEPIKMDPHLIDLLWEVHREVGAKEPIWVVCGYRSPGHQRDAAPALERRRQVQPAHATARPSTSTFPAFRSRTMRAAGLRSQRGGVGFYPSFGLRPLDTGSVRHWPRMPEAQLAGVLSKGPLNSRFASDAGSPQADRGGAGRYRQRPARSGARCSPSCSEPPRARTRRSTPRPQRRGARAARQADRARPSDAIEPGAEKSAASEPRRDKVAAAVPLPPLPAAPQPQRRHESAAAPAKPARQARELPGGVGVLEAAPQPGELRGRARQARNPAPARPQAASLVGAREHVGKRCHQRARLLAGPAEHRCGRRAPPRSPARTRCARRPIFPTSSAEPATTASVAPWPAPERTDAAASGATLAYAAQPGSWRRARRRRWVRGAACRRP